MSTARAAAAQWLADEDKEEVDADFREAKAEQRAEQVRPSRDGDEEPFVPCDLPTAAFLANLAWTGIDILVTRWQGPGYALTRPEKVAIVEASIPVVQLYVPELGVDGPWLHLAAVAGAIYVAKGLSGAKTPANGPEPVIDPCVNCGHSRALHADLRCAHAAADGKRCGCTGFGASTAAPGSRAEATA